MPITQKEKKMFVFPVPLQRAMSDTIRVAGNRSASEFVRDAVRQRVNRFSDREKLELEGFASPLTSVRGAD